MTNTPERKLKDCGCACDGNCCNECGSGWPCCCCGYCNPTYCEYTDCEEIAQLEVRWTGIDIYGRPLDTTWWFCREHAKLGEPV